MITVPTAGVQTGGGITSITVASLSVEAGDWIVVMGRVGSNRLYTFSDTQGNRYFPLLPFIESSGLAMAQAIARVGTTGTVDVTISQVGSGAMAAHVMVIRGLDAEPLHVFAAQGNSNLTTLPIPNITTTCSAEHILITGIMNPGSFQGATPPTNYTEPANADSTGGSLAYRIVSAPDTYGGNWTYGAARTAPTFHGALLAPGATIQGAQSIQGVGSIQL